uniref:Uncharacterized protein n=1 Tax=Cannabis sativa TaxID=3483 RepID=A0A803PM08_CANSA
MDMKEQNLSSWSSVRVPIKEENQDRDARATFIKATVPREAAHTPEGAPREVDKKAKRAEKSAEEVEVEGAEEATKENETDVPLPKSPRNEI